MLNNTAENMENFVRKIRNYKNAKNKFQPNY